MSNTEEKPIFGNSYKRLIGGPADGAMLQSNKEPVHGLVIHWAYGLRLDYKFLDGIRQRITLLDKGISLDLIDEEKGCSLRIKGMTHIYVYSKDVEMFTYVGLYPLSNPLGIKGN